MLLNIFLALYVLPFIIVMLGGIPFIWKDKGLFWAIFAFAFIPLMNIFFAATVVVVGSQMFYDWRKNPRDYHP